MLRDSVAVLVIAGLTLAAPAMAQLSDTGPITFPPTTQTGLTQCGPPITSLDGPSVGGKVLFFRGGFFLRNGSVLYGTFPNQVPACINDIDINFVPAAESINFTLTSLTAQTIQVFAGSVTPTTYPFSQPGSIAVSIPALVAGISIQALHPYGVSDLTITQHALNRGLVQFDLGASVPPTADQAKILLSKAVWDVGYPSSAQLANDSSGNPQMRIAGTLVDRVTGQPKSGPVYLRIEDPPDSAPYRDGDASADDNDGPPATLSSTTVQADNTGRFEAIVVFHSHVAGDNYRIVGSADQSFNCGGTCPRSTVLTLWKRIYLEEQHMFRRGAFVSDLARSGGSVIPVSDPAPFRGLAAHASRLELVHADSGDGQGFYFDIVTFADLSQDSNGDWIVRTDETLPREYGASASHVPQTPIMDVMRDGIGVVDGGTYDSAPEYVTPLFAAMYTEVKPVPAPAVLEVPYVPELTYITARYFAARWLQNGITSNAFSRQVRSNVFHQMALSQMPTIADPATGRLGAELGVTVVGGGSNYSAILLRRIEDLTAGNVADPLGGLVGREYFALSASIVAAETTAHETVHLWVHTGGDGQGHCTAERWQHDSLNCLMHTPYSGPGHADGMVDLHYENHGNDSEYMTIRRSADPVPLQ